MHTCRGNSRKKKKNSLVTQKCLLKLYSKKKKKKASTEPDVSLRFGAKPVFPSAINSSSQENSEGEKIVQIFRTHPPFIYEIH